LVPGMGVIEMAHTGPPAKGNKHGRNPNVDWIDVPDVPFEEESPDLPKVRGKRWPALVERWWENVRRMPHCALWTATDWDFAVETAFLKLAFWTEYNAGEVKSTLATEIRRREDMLGVTGEARRKLRIRYVDPGAPVAAVEEPAEDLVVEEQGAAGGSGTVTPLASRRRRLTA
jgi:hypothetical protein